VSICFHDHSGFAETVGELGSQFMIQATEQDLLAVALASVNRNDKRALGYQF
jgi:hypothetical protein